MGNGGAFGFKRGNQENGARGRYNDDQEVKKKRSRSGSSTSRDRDRGRGPRNAEIPSSVFNYESRGLSKN